MNKTVAANEGEERLSIGRTLAWSGRGVSYAVNTVFISYIVYVCTDILGLNAAIIGGLLLGSKIIDGFTDLGFGYILDKTKTRFGKARPYELFLIPLWLFTALMFAVPHFGTTFQYIWVFITYVICNAVCQTALGGADPVYLSRAFKSSRNQIRLMSVNGIMIYLGTLIFSVFVPLFLSRGGTTQGGWIKLSVILGLSMTLIGLLRFIFIKEVAADEPAVKKQKYDKGLSLKETFRLLGKNKYVFIIALLMLVTTMLNNMGTAQTYYFKYIIGNTDVMSFVSLAAMASLVGLMIFPILAAKIGTTKILHISMVVGVIGIGLRTIGTTNIATIFIGSLLLSLSTTPLSTMISIYLIDCMDYGEWKTGTRIEGPIASISNFASKIGAGIASGFIGLVMGMVGYDGLAQVQTPLVNNAIVFIYNWFPLIMLVIMLILSRFYQVDRQRPQMNADLAARHQAK